MKPDIHAAVFHYQARAVEEDRLQVCISTPEMRKAAWELCHKQQLVLDGTFGLCSSRLLVFIAMGIDTSQCTSDGGPESESRARGVPVALFLFSAPTGNKATHAGYDTRILTELLGHWRDWLGTTERGDRFEPYVAMTDTDPKERGALLRIWPGIILLLCRFHIRQCWTNKRKQVVAHSLSDWTQYVRERLLGLEER